MTDSINSASATVALMNASQANVAIASHKARDAQTKLDAKEIAKVEATAKEFESVFISEMMKPMFEDIGTDGMFGGGKGEEIFRGMLLNEYGKIIANTGSIGLTDQVKQQMIMMQEQADLGT